MCLQTQDKLSRYYSNSQTNASPPTLLSWVSVTFLSLKIEIIFYGHTHRAVFAAAVTWSNHEKISAALSTRDHHDNKPLPPHNTKWCECIYTPLMFAPNTYTETLVSVHT